MKTDKTDNAEQTERIQGKPMLYLALSDPEQFERVVREMSRDGSDPQSNLGPKER